MQCGTDRYSTTTSTSNCYTFMENNITWSEASSMCTARGQVLIDISSGIPQVLRKVTDFGSVHYNPTHKSMFCPPVSFWAHTQKPGKTSYHSV